MPYALIAILISYPLGKVIWEVLDSPCCSQGRSCEAGFAGSDHCTILCKKKDCNVGKPCCRPKFSFSCLMIWVLKPDFSYMNSWIQFKRSCTFSRVPYDGLIMYFLPTQWKTSQVSLSAGISSSIYIVGIRLKSVYWLILLLCSFIWCKYIPAPDILALNTDVNWAAKLTGTTCKQVQTKGLKYPSSSLVFSITLWKWSG